jgi:hypothetical protein
MKLLKPTITYIQAKIKWNYLIKKNLSTMLFDSFVGEGIELSNENQGTMLSHYTNTSINQTCTSFLSVLSCYVQT